MKVLFICWPVFLSVRLSDLNFVISHKNGFEITHFNLSNTTKLILLDSLLQKVTPGEIQIPRLSLKLQVALKTCFRQFCMLLI